jgi:hypothetical protein
MLLLLVKLCHYILISFILIAPFINIPALLFIHAMLSMSLLFHWYLDSDICFFTYLEAYLTGKNVDNGFIYSIVSPVYKISKLQVRQIIWTITILLLFISSHKVILYLSSCGDKYKCLYNAYNKNNI